ncbi:MAG: T9SS type A sorting domain-containing protein [Candidatus Latescibacteria bacterium]|nr:T9SS type A sorting domain-containing protein [Candidatus Latescibacterota bacterium]
MRNLTNFFSVLRIQSLSPLMAVILFFAVLPGAPRQADAEDYLTMIVIRLTDDSPEDGEGGALLYSEQIFIDGQEAEIMPFIEGGIRRSGLLETVKDEAILLRYEIDSFDKYDYKLIENIEVVLELANDYRVEQSSNLQIDSSGRLVFLTVSCAEGNVKDGSNQQFVRLQYGPDGITGVEKEEDDQSLPERSSLRQNVPNPFNAVTTIRYQLPEASHVELAIYDVLGRKVQVLVDSFVKAGYRTTVWDAKEQGSGIYFVRMEAGGFVEVRKMVLLR